MAVTMHRASAPATTSVSSVPPSTNPHGSRSLTDQELARLQASAAPKMVKAMKDSMSTLAQDLENLRLAQAAAIRADQHRQKAEKLGKEALELQISAEEHKKKAEEHKARAIDLKESGLKKIADAEADEQEKLAKIFYKTFNGQKAIIPTDQISVIKSFAIRALTVEPGPTGGPKINDMAVIIEFLKAKPAKACDFRAFENRINDIAALGEFLKRSPSVEAVGFAKSIESAATPLLASAKAERGPTLKIRYLEK